MNKAFLIVIISSGIITNIFAGAWPQKKEGGFYQLNFRYLSASKIYNNFGTKFTIPKLNDLTLSFFGEYGITDNLSLNSSFLFYKIVNIETQNQNSDNEVKGIGDLEIGAKLKLLDLKNGVISVGFNLGIPAAEERIDGSISTGDGEFNQSLNIQFGCSFYPLSVYFNSILKFNNRTEGFSDEAAIGIEGGYSFFSKFILIGKMEFLKTLRNGDESVTGTYGIFQNNQQYLAYSTQLAYSLTKNIGISFTYESGTAGRNIISAPVFGAGIYFEY